MATTDTWDSPALDQPIGADLPAIQRKFQALVKGDPSLVQNPPVGAKRLMEISGGNWQVQQYNGSTWANLGKLQMDVDTVDGHDAAITPQANTIAVRNASGKLEGDITGNAVSADSAVTLSETLGVELGGTGATTAAQARQNLGVPPTSHASTGTTHGVGNATQYGHVKLSDAVDSPSGVTGGTAATPAAVKAAKDAADAAQSSADSAQSSADAAMDKASTLATASTPGIVKPGTGMTVDASGALNVKASTASTPGLVKSSETAQAGAVPVGGADGSLNADWLKKAMDAAAAAQQAADAAQETADQAISAVGGAGNVSLISQRSTTGQWSITGLDVGKPLYITVSSSTNSGYVFFRIKSGSLDGTSPNDQTFQFGRYDSGSWVSLTPPGTVIIPTSTSVIVDVASISNITMRAYQ